MAAVKATSLEPRVEKAVLSADGKIAFTSQDVEIEIRNGVPWVLGCTTMRGGDGTGGSPCSTRFRHTRSLVAGDI